MSLSNERSERYTLHRQRLADRCSRKEFAQSIRELNEDYAIGLDTLELKAIGLITTRLGDIERYRGDIFPRPELHNSTGQHLQQVNILIEELPHPSEQERTRMHRMALCHDWGEIVREFFTVATQKARLENSQIGEVEERIAAFTCRLAFASARTDDTAHFDAVIEDFRQQTTGLTALQAAKKIKSLIHRFDWKGAFPDLDAAAWQQVDAYGQRWMSDYQDVEQQRDFAGRVVKLLERIDGNIYYCEMMADAPALSHVYANSNHVLTSLNRAESGLAALYRDVKTPEELTVANAMKTTAYQGAIDYLDVPSCKVLDYQGATASNLTPKERGQARTSGKRLESRPDTCIRAQEIQAGVAAFTNALDGGSPASAADGLITHYRLKLRYQAALADADFIPGFTADGKPEMLVDALPQRLEAAARAVAERQRRETREAVVQGQGLTEQQKEIARLYQDQRIRANAEPALA